MSNAYYPMKLIDFCMKYDEIKNILLLVEGVMVDDHTLVNISHSGKRISTSTSSRVIFFFQSVIFSPHVVIYHNTIN
jgi:hypothetical protein